jgi:probable rRNA maturation factor
LNQIFLENTTDWSLPVSEDFLLESIERVVKSVIGSKGFELSIQIVDDSEIQVYNREKRGKDKPTDVLSFPVSLGVPGGYSILGDVVISVDTLQRQAIEIGHSEKEEFFRLLVHGILHLLGYDHEISPQEEAKMIAKENECLELFEDEGKSALLKGRKDR